MLSPTAWPEPSAPTPSAPEPSAPEPSAPEPSGTSPRYLHRNLPEPDLSICTETFCTFRNLARNLVLDLHRIAPELIWAKDPIAKCCCWGKKNNKWITNSRSPRVLTFFWSRFGFLSQRPAFVGTEPQPPRSYLGARPTELWPNPSACVRCDFWLFRCLSKNQLFVRFSTRAQSGPCWNDIRSCESDQSVDWDSSIVLSVLHPFRSLTFWRMRAATWRATQKKAFQIPRPHPGLSPKNDY